MYVGKPIKRISEDTKFPALLDLDLLTVFKQEEDTVTGFFNSTAQHSIPIVVNTLSNAYAMMYNIGKNLMTEHNLIIYPYRQYNANLKAL